jgi:hypothetical protein
MPSFLHNTIDPAQDVVTASVASILGRPKVFKTDEGQIGVAVMGVLMPVRFYITAFSNALFSTSDKINSDPNIRKEFKSLYRGVTVPSRYSNAFAESPHKAAQDAVRDLFSEIRKNSYDVRAEIQSLIEEFESEYAELYTKPVGNPDWLTTEKVTVLDTLLNAWGRKRSPLDPHVLRR